MKAELITTINILFILILFVRIVAYAITYFKSNVRRFNYNFVKKIYSNFLEFSKILMRKEYVSYEKYDVWRYCVRF
jgi:hypothetical protein